MKTFKIYTKSKRSPLFFDFQGKTFTTSKEWGVTEFSEVEKPDAVRDEWNIQAESLEDAKYKWTGLMMDIQSKSKKAAENWRIEKLAKIQSLLKKPVIPTTVENLSLVLEYLNTKNWGSWTLPTMSIGYRAHQYDCEGTTITTITLNQPIMFCGKMERNFKSGSKRGHLEKYNAI